MRSFVFCTSYLPNPYVNAYNERYGKWITYYSQRLPSLGADRVFLIDDGSPMNAVRLDVTLVDIVGEYTDPILPEGPVMLRFPVHFGRSSIEEFPGWWRSFSVASIVARRYGYEKIIHIESDAYVLSKRMMEHIEQLHGGWTVFWCDSQKFPETAIQVICEECIDDMETFYRRGVPFWFKARRGSDIPEGTLHFTSICKTFKGDRFGELGGRIPADVDYVCQLKHGMKLPEGAMCG